MGRIRIDPGELADASSRFTSAGPSLSPLGQRTHLGPGIFGFPVLTKAVERFVASIDGNLKTDAGLLSQQVDGLGATARSFDSFEGNAQSDLDTLAKGLES